MIETARSLVCFLFCLFYLTVAGGIPGQAAAPGNPRLRFVQYDPAKLPHPFVLRFHRDSTGFLWIATRGGLCRFDGKNYKHYQHNPDLPGSLSHNYVRCIQAENPRSLWLGTFGRGLCRFDPVIEKFESFPNPISTESNRIHELIFDGKGRIWLATEGGGLQLFDKRSGKYRVYQDSSGVARPGLSLNGRSLLLDTRNRLWYGTSDKGVAVLDLHTGRFLPGFEQLLPKGNILSMVEGLDGDVYLGTAAGLYRVSATKPVLLDSFPEKPDGKGPLAGRIFAMARDPSGTIWLATLKGLSLFDPVARTFSHEKHHPFNSTGIQEERLISVYADVKGKIWIGSWNKGMASTASSNFGFQAIRPRPDWPGGDPFSGIIQIRPGLKGRVWLLTQSNGLIDFDPKTGQTEVFSPSRLLGPEIGDGELLSFFLDSRRTIWLGRAQGGLYRLPLARLGKEPFQRVLQNPAKIPLEAHILHCAEDSGGNIWMASFTGMWHWDRKTDRFSSIRFRDASGKEGKVINQISCILLSRSGKLFLGTNGMGLVHFDPGTGKYTHFNDLRDSKSGKIGIVETLREDLHGRLWVGTLGGGLLVTRAQHPGEFRRFGPGSGMPESTVNILEIDEDGGIWLAGKDLYRVFPKGSPGQLPDSLAFHGMPSGDVVASNLYKSGSSCRSTDGVVFLGGADGLTYFHSRSVSDSMPDFYPAITHLRILDQDWEADSSIVFKQSLSLPYNQNFLRFQIANLGLALEGNLSCRYFMEGLSTSWQQTPSHGELQFTGLAPGTYCLRIQAANLEGKWNPVERRLWIEILPPWWQTWWFRSLMGLAFLGAIAATVGWRTRVATARAQQEARIRIEKLELELRALQAQINPHFMFNALNSIEDFIWKKEITQAADYLARFARLMRLILENSMYETVPLEKELEGVKLYLQLEAMRMENGFDFEIVLRLPSLAKNLEVPPMLLQPFIENAVLHGIAPLKVRRGSILVEISQIEDKLQVKITDNGVGRTLKNQGHKSLGTSLTRERIVKLNHGDERSFHVIDLKDPDQRPAGTQVLILLPVE